MQMEAIVLSAQQANLPRNPPMKPTAILVGLLILLSGVVLSACPGRNMERGGGSMGGGMQQRSSRY